MKPGIHILLAMISLAFTATAAEREVLTLDLGSGVSMELVKIPAGTFLMGTPEPAHPLGHYLNWMYLPAALLAVFVAVVLFRSLMRKSRPQISLAGLIFCTAMAGCAAGLYMKEQELRQLWALQEGVLPSEKPAHTVTIAKPFYMGKYEVTQEQYQAIMGNNPSHLKGAKHPVDTVSWDDTQEFCKKLAEKTGKTVRLPTEAEWEYACRAGTSTNFHSGNSEADLAQVAWYGVISGDQTHPVGMKEANGFGLYDMHGNVIEWCNDHYAEYSLNSATGYNQETTNLASRVVRGGSWINYASYCRSAFRLRNNFADIRFINFGFRVVFVPWTGR